MSGSDRKKAVLGVYWMSFMSVGTVMMKLLIMTILSRLLLPVEFGAVAAVYVVVSFAEIFWMMGIGPAIIQKKTLTESDIVTGNILNILFGLIIYLVIYIFASAIAGFVGIENIPMLRVFSLIFIIHSISGVPQSLLQRDMKFKQLSLINIFSLFLYGGFAIFFALAGLGAWSLVFAHIAQAAVKTISLLIIKRIPLSLNVTMSSVKDLLFLGTGFTLSRVVNNFALQGDNFVVSRALGSFSLGFYNRAYQLLLVPTNLIGSVLDKVLFPLFAKYQDKHEKIKYVFLNITAFVALMALPITVFSLVMGGDLIRTVLGPNWDDVEVLFKVLIISLFFRTAYKISDALVKSLGAVYKRTWLQVIYATLVIGGAYIGKEWGVSGVAVSTSIAIFLSYVMVTFLLKLQVNLKTTELITYLAPVFLVTAPIGTVVYFVGLMLTDFSYPVVRLIITGTVTLILYAVSFKYFLVRSMPRDFIDFLNVIKEITFASKVFKFFIN